MEVKSLTEEMRDFMVCRNETSVALQKIYEQCQLSGKRYKAVDILTRTSAVTSGLALIGLTASTFLSAGLTTPALVAAASGCASSVVNFKAASMHRKAEHEMTKKAETVLQRDNSAVERLRFAAQKLKDLRSTLEDIEEFLDEAAKLGLITARKLQVLTSSSLLAARTVDTLVDFADFITKANTVLRTVGFVLTVLSIPIDLFMIVRDLKDCTEERYSEAAIQIKAIIEALKAQYQQFRNDHSDLIELMQ